MAKAADRDPIYRGRRFTAETIELCVRWILTYLLGDRDLSAMMAERGLAHDHPALGTQVRPRIRATMGTVLPAKLAHPGAWTRRRCVIEAVPTGCTAQSTATERASASCTAMSARSPRHKLFPGRGVETRRRLAGDHQSRRQSRDSPKSGQPSRARWTLETCQGPGEPLPQQSDRAGSSRDQAAPRLDARPQNVRIGGHHAGRSRAGAPNPEGPVQRSKSRRRREALAEAVVGCGSVPRPQ